MTRPSSTFWISALWVMAVLGASAFLIWGPGGTNYGQDITKRASPDAAYKVVASRSGLSLRETPSIVGKNLETVPFGTKVQMIVEPRPVSITIDNIPGSFRRIRWNEKEGYVFSGYLVPEFFDFQSVPATLEEALRPWLTGDTTTISWLTPFDVWVLESQVWKYRAADGTGDFPRAPSRLLNSGIFVPGSLVKGRLTHHALALPEYLVIVRPDMEGVSLTFETNYNLESLVKDGVSLSF